MNYYSLKINYSKHIDLIVFNVNYRVLLNQILLSKMKKNHENKTGN